MGQDLFAVAEPESVGYKGRRAAVVLNIRKQSGTNTVEVVHAMKERLADVEKRLPQGYTIDVARDQSEFIENSIGAVKEHLVLGAICAAECIGHLGPRPVGDLKALAGPLA